MIIQDRNLYSKQEFEGSKQEFMDFRCPKQDFSVQSKFLGKPEFEGPDSEWVVLGRTREVFSSNNIFKVRGVCAGLMT